VTTITITWQAVVVFIGVFLSVLALSLALRKILRNMTVSVQAAVVAETTPGPAVLFEREATETIWTRIGSLAIPSNADEAESLRGKLSHAGFRGTTSLITFAALRTVIGLGLGLGAVVFVGPKSLLGLLGVGLMGVLTGYYLPSIVVHIKGENRRQALSRALPDTLDQLVCSVEAGLGLNAALERIATEMQDAAPELAYELQLVNDEIALGVHRKDALRRLEQRNGIEEMSSLVNVLVQAERYGTSIAQALRVHSDLVRKRRMLGAEEQAAKISPKLTVMMIVFILPTLFVVLIGPTIINLLRSVVPLFPGGSP